MLMCPDMIQRRKRFNHEQAFPSLIFELARETLFFFKLDHVGFRPTIPSKISSKRSVLVGPSLFSLLGAHK